jgi:small subunit ribosomal protein S2
MAVANLRDLFDAGVHFGHPTNRWNPKMKPYIYMSRSKIHIIDLEKSASGLQEACDFASELALHNREILFVGTKKQAQDIVEQEASRVGMPFVNQRWLGGMLTNYATISRRLARMKEMEAEQANNAWQSFSKKEVGRLQDRLAKLQRFFNGIRDLHRLPFALYVVDTVREHIAVAEAQKLGIPVIALLDTNCDPDQVDYSIPGNDDAIKSIRLITHLIADAISRGQELRAAQSSEAGAEEAMEAVAADPTADVDTESGENDTKEDAG